MEMMLAVMSMHAAHEESQRKSDNISKGWKMRRTKAVSGEGLIIHRATPGWLDWKNPKKKSEGFVENPARCALVREIFQKALPSFVNAVIMLDSGTLRNLIKRGHFRA